jgi:hypothetical protein
MKPKEEFYRIYPSDLVTEWLQEMSTKRWELITIDRDGRYIFRRRIIDQTMRSLQAHMDDCMEQYEKEPSEFNSGLKHGACVAYSIYTNT